MHKPNARNGQVREELSRDVIKTFLPFRNKVRSHRYNPGFNHLGVFLIKRTKTPFATFMPVCLILKNLCMFSDGHCGVLLGKSMEW